MNTVKIDKEIKKKEALKRMKKLRMHEYALREFEEENQLNQSEFYGSLYWVENEDVLKK